MSDLICDGCGASITSETQFCKECGRPVNSGREAALGTRKQPSAASTEKRASAKSLAPSSIPGAIAVLLGVAFTIFVFASHPLDFRHQNRTLTHAGIAAVLAIIGAILLILKSRKPAETNTAVE